MFSNAVVNRVTLRALSASRAAVSDGLGVRVRKLGLSDEDLVDEDLAPGRANGAKLPILARSDDAGNLQPFADIAELTDALPHIGGGAIDGDFQRNEDV